MSRLLPFVLCLSVCLRLTAQEVITVRSGNGAPASPDGLITTLAGPFAAALTPADFALAQTGPAAEILPAGTFGWNWALPNNPSALWVSTSQAIGGHLSALYAVPFTVTSPVIGSATLSIGFFVDEDLGDGPNEGVFVNGISVPGTTTIPGANWATQTSFMNLDVTHAVTPGLNYLYLNVRNLAGAGGIDFGGTVTIFPTPEFQTNQPGASLNIDGVSSSPTMAGSVSKCVGETVNININSSNVGSGWELAVSLSPLAPLSGAGIALSDGQVVNIRLSQSFYLNGGLFPSFLPFPGAITAPVTAVSPVDIAAQAFMLDGTLPLGVAVSGGIELHAAVGGVNSVAGPTGDDVSVVVDVTAAPLCWCPSGIPFYAATYASMNIASNGRVLFGGVDDDFSVSIPEALTDNPFAGLWADLSPNISGTVTASSPAPGIARVDWVSVPYFGQTANATYGVEFNCATGDVMIDGLQGVMADPSNVNQFLGLSPGNAGPATDPGAAPFALGAVGAAGAATDILYDFAPGQVASLVPGTLSTLLFTPDGGGNYVWFGF